jgi:hypothetical protein
MPIIPNPAAFIQKPSLWTALGDAGTAGAQASGMIQETLLAKAKLEGWREARDLQRQQIAMETEAFEMKKADREAGIQAAEGISQYRQAQQPRNDRRNQATSMGPDRLGLTQGAAAGMVDADEQAENAQVEEIAKTVTKDPRARQAFLEDVRGDRQQRAISQGLQTAKGRLQDTILGFSNTPEAAGFQQDFEALAGELEQILPDTDPKLAAAVIDDVGRRLAEKKKLVYEHVLRERRDMAARSFIQQMAGQYPPDHPMQETLRFLDLAIEAGDLDGKDVLTFLKTQEMGLIQVAPGQYMTREAWGVEEGKRAETARKTAEGQARIEQGDRKLDQADEKLGQGRKALDLRERTVAENERHNRETEKKGDTTSVTPKQRADLIERRIKAISGTVEGFQMSAAEIRKEAMRQVDEELASGAAQPEATDPLDALDPSELDGLSEEDKKKLREMVGG